MPELLRICLIVCPLVFLAGFIDSVAGGGGIISIPAYMIAGLPTKAALGTNKFAMSFGTSLASYKYAKSGNVIFSVALISAIGSIAGSLCGTNLALIIPDRYLKITLLVILPVVAVFLALKRNFGKNFDGLKYSGFKLWCITFAIGLFIGCYDGLVGPGTGTFLIMAFSGILGTDLLKSSGCAKVSNLASNLTSLTVYALSGNILYLVALPAAVFCMAGNFIGAKYAISHGSYGVRKVMFSVLFLMLVKIALDTAGISLGG